MTREILPVIIKLINSRWSVPREGSNPISRETWIFDRIKTWPKSKKWYLNPNLNIDPNPDFCNLNTSLTWAQTQTRITHHNLERHTYTKNLSKHIDFSPSYVLPMLYRVIDMDWSYSRQLYCGFVYRSTGFWDDLNLKKCSINILFFGIKWCLKK